MKTMPTDYLTSIKLVHLWKKWKKKLGCDRKPQ